MRCLVSLLIGCVALPAISAAQTVAPSATLRVQIADSTVATFSLRDLAAMPHDTASVVRDGVRAVVRGPTLISVLRRAGLVPFESQKGPLLARVVVAGAGDGYRVAFGAGELDPTIGRLRVLVIGPTEGSTAETLRLVVPDDARGARSVRLLHTLQVRDMP